MELKEFDIMLDIKKSKKIEDIEVVQKDYESNIFNISIVEDFKPYNLAGLNVEIAFAKSDGTTVLQDENNGVVIVSAIEGKIICTLKTNTIAAPGKVLAEVRILQDLKLLTTARFDFFVRKAIVDDETIKSTNEFPILNEKIDEVNDLIEYVQGMEAIKGDDGKSAYEVWLEAGNTGTVEDYLASLKGEQGMIGPIGPDGKSIEYKWDGTRLGVRLEGEVEYQYVDLQGPEGPEGEMGVQGPKGDPGTSLKILGNYDTLEELILAYPDGSGLDGGFMVGIDYYYWGIDGWTNAGPLQGPQGEQGLPGQDGYTPVKGIDYFDGEQGPRGLPGVDGKSLEFIWDETKLGIRIEGQTEYQYVELKGSKGDPGTPGSDANVTETNIIDALGYTPANETDLDDKVDNSRVLTDVPENAKFTDTTYSEISTAEIDAGTASALRTITGRRIGYIINKVSDMISTAISSLTKSDVGLGNVDNVKQMPISNGVLENYREKLVTLSGTSTTINLNNGNVFTHTLSGNTTYSISNAQSQAHSFTLIITQTGTVRTITFPASVKWQGGEIPDLSGANKTYILTFVTVDSGLTWLGMFGGEF